MLLRNQRALSTSGECTGPRSPLHPFQASSLVKPVVRLAVEGCDSPPGALRAPTSPLRGEARCDSPPGALRAPTSPLRGEAMLRPPTERPRFPPRRAARADLPLRGEAMLRPPTECPRFPTRRAPRADLPTAWGGDAARLRAPTSPLRGEAMLR